MLNKFVKTSNSGFTLVELAIVVVIIGLMVGGVVGGKSLIESAERQALINEVNSYHTAIKAFELEYNGLPGDLRNATSFWPSLTADGNGNKQIDLSWSTANWEAYRVFNQLELAEILSGDFFYSTAWPGHYTERYSPISSYGENNIYLIATFGRRADHNVSWQWRSYGKADKVGIKIGGNFNTGYGINGAAFTASEARRIDKKIDDGVPDTGSVIANRGYNEEAGAQQRCTSLVFGGQYDFGCEGSFASCQGPGSYNIAESGKRCTLYFFN